MEILLNILLLLVGIADAVAFFQLRKRINGWGDHLDEPLSDEEEAFVMKRFKLIRALSVVGAVLLVIRVVIYELFPLIRG